jgi:uncharacterized protein (TIGR02145 family)
MKLNMDLAFCILLLFSITAFQARAQVSIGTSNPDSSALLDIFSNEKGIIISRLSDQQRDSIQNPTTGLIIFNTTSGCYNYRYGDDWMQLCGLLIGRINTLNCTSATHNGILFQGTPASGVNSMVPYTGGNGGPHNGQVVNSTGVTGLTATLTAGIFAVGNGTLTYNITGTPASSGTTSFALNIGGQSCTLTRNVNAGSSYPPGTVHCISTPTAIVDVLNPVTGKTWMDRNLGASQVAVSSTDANAYGDLYQWGRRADGHQCRNSGTTTTLSNSDQPPHGNFIVVSNPPRDWRSPQNANLWQGVNGINNPCPINYRLPTESEFNEERLSWSSNNTTGAFASPLKLSVAGYRGPSGLLAYVGTYGSYWNSTVNSPGSRHLFFSSSNAEIRTDDRAFGMSVRCIKD